MSTAAPTSRRPEPDGFLLWPENPFWSFHFQRLVGQIPTGGADFAEVFDACRDVRAGDIDTWFDNLMSLAEDLDRRSRRSIHAGNAASARALLLRATNYRRAAASFLADDDPRRDSAIRARRATFRQAASLPGPRITPVEIPYGRTSLPGYVLDPVHRSRDGDGPGVVMFGGTDAGAEEMYFAAGRALSERGFTVLAFDGPGQGEALRRGIPGRHDWEVPAGAAYDFLVARDGVDPKRVAVLGQSLGGHLAARAAARDSRWAACVVWGAIVDLRAVVRAGLAVGDPTMVFFQRAWQHILQLPSADVVVDALSSYSLVDVAAGITCPTLVVHGASDNIVPVSEAHHLVGLLSAIDHHYIEYAAGEPGSTHCQLDALTRVSDDITDFLLARMESSLADDGVVDDPPRVYRDHLDAVTGGTSELADIWEPNGVLAFPYGAATGTPLQLDGIDAIAAYFGGLDAFSGFTISDLVAHPTGVREWVAEFHGSSTITATGAPYEQDYIVRFATSERGRLTWMREYWDPTRMMPA